jgi:hypothetical protein
MYTQDFIVARVDHLDGDPAVAARRKGQRYRTGELRKGLLVQSPAQGLADFFQAPLSGKNVWHTEAAAVIVAVEKQDP